MDHFEPSRAMRIGMSIFLIAVGAILRYAVDLRITGIEIQTVGLILMIVGIIGLVTYRRILTALGHLRLFVVIFSRFLVPIDRALYKRTRGRLSLVHAGVRRAGALPTLLLTTTGHKTGQPRSTPVMYLEDGDQLVVVASNFGRERHPAWSRNLLAHPRAVVRIRDRERSVVAHQATKDELRALWPRLLEIYPTWDAYAERTNRDFRAFFLRLE